jgi:hypothetical protein
MHTYMHETTAQHVKHAAQHVMLPAMLSQAAHQCSLAGTSRAPAALELPHLLLLRLLRLLRPELRHLEHGQRRGVALVRGLAH